MISTRTSLTGLPLLCATALLVVALAGCSRGSNRTSPVVPVYPATYPVTESQGKAFEDGIITFGEYEAAIFREAACLADAGIEYEPKLDRSGKFYSSDVVFRGGDPEAQAKVVDGCLREFAGATAELWNWQNQPSIETLNRARNALAACLREAGVDVPASASADDFRTLQRDPPPGFFDCANRITGEFSLPVLFTGS